MNYCILLIYSTFVHYKTITFITYILISVTITILCDTEELQLQQKNVIENNNRYIVYRLYDPPDCGLPDLPLDMFNLPNL